MAEVKLKDMKFLSGTKETITMTELRSRPGDIITQVEMGVEFSITRGGKIVAVLSKPEPTALELAAEIRRIERWKKGKELK